MEAYPEAVRKILAIYIGKANSFTEKELKVVCIAGLFDYLSTAEVKSVLNTPVFAKFRNVLLNKIHEFSNDSYLIARRQQYHRLFAVFREVFTYLVQDDSVPLRRSERQKQRAVMRFNERFAYCSSPLCIGIAAELKQWSAVKPNDTPVSIKPTAVPKPAAVPKPTAVPKPINIKVKVLPRRSARLMNKV